nr:NADH-quinone oxidoreductase subunit C [Nocardia otitidiscaviarum]
MTFHSPSRTESPPEAAVDERKHGESNEPIEPPIMAGQIQDETENDNGTAESGPAPDEIIGVRRGMFGVSGTGDTSGYGRLVRTVTLPGGTEPPYGGYFDGLVATLRAALGAEFDAAVEKIVVFRGELTLHVRREHLVAVARTLRDDPALRFELCLGVSGVHYPDDQDRELHAVYQLNSITHNRRLRVEVSAPDADPHIPSLYAVYPTTDWHERETYDFFGILFDGHPSLTRISMPDDWRGHPQRKDYPLGGIPVEYKGARIPPPDERRAYS